ncbi:DUF559 domain-containing protein [Aurantiacibacter gangjinensis]|uniref:Uncharacterized protein n=1 Tax=Aurantiacibacter gangjinensis TaxID=502682 RepID=A0A0G9MLM0_9SPHN|nr:DUF559 domain-containing protein [Aurantiacibacter gangjinensis]APE27467.1 hypothetical protein BMF35_a0638 [Aurantiacibacter gangjinensis]KLE31534.1 hypothetical protein AAW01_08175 [Aurantiacibacter gangjinensis]
MTERKTLKVREDAEAPKLKKKGRGWEISEKRLDNLHEQARKMRRHSSEAHKALAARFSKADLGKYTFKRFAVVGSAIVDFNCHNLGMAIIIDEEGEEALGPQLMRRRDKSLEAVGVKVMHLEAADILENMDDVLKRITAGMRLRIADKAEARRQHFAENPRQTKPRYDRDGNGPPRDDAQRDDRKD